MYSFEEIDVINVVNRLMAELPEKGENTEAPVGIVLGGQPGSGKTTIQKIAAKSYPDIVIINGDEYRKFHPQFERILEEQGDNFPEYTGAFSGAVTEMYLARLISERRNVVIEGTLRTAEVPLNTCQKFKQNGYKTMLAVMAVKPEISYLSTILRYEKMLKIGMIARKTQKQHHDKVVSVLVSNMEEIQQKDVFDHVLVFDRQGKCISGVNNSQAYNSLGEVLFGKWYSTEIDQLREIYKDIIRLKKERNDPDIDGFISEFKNVIEIGNRFDDEKTQ